MANQLSLIVNTVSPTIKEHGADLYMWHKSELSKNTKKWAKCIPSKLILLHKLTVIFLRNSAKPGLYALNALRLLTRRKYLYLLHFFPHFS